MTNDNITWKECPYCTESVPSNHLYDHLPCEGVEATDGVSAR